MTYILRFLAVAVLTAAIVMLMAFYTFGVSCTYECDLVRGATW